MNVKIPEGSDCPASFTATNLIVWVAFVANPEMVNTPCGTVPTSVYVVAPFREYLYVIISPPFNSVGGIIVIAAVCNKGTVLTCFIDGAEGAA